MPGVADTQVTPGPATVITRRQQPVTFIAGNKQVIPLTKNLFIRGIFLRLQVQPTLTAANNIPANTQLGDEWGCVTKIEIIANSATVLFSAAGSDLKPLIRLLGSGYLSGHNPRIQPNLGDGVTANPTLDSTVYIPFINPRSRRPFDTILFAPELSDLRLEVTWASDQTSINSSATGFTTNPSIEVYTREQSAPVDNATGKIILPQFYRRVLKTPVVFAGANSDFPKQLNTGPIYRGVVLNVVQAGQENPSTLLNVKVSNGATTYLDQSYNPLQAKLNEDWDINEFQFMFGQAGLITNNNGVATNGRTVADVGAAFSQATLNQNFSNLIAAINSGQFLQSPGAVSPKCNPLAWNFVDFCEDGYMSEAIDTQAVGDTFINFNVSGACTINILTQELLRIAR